MSNSIAHDYFSLFKYRPDLSDDHSIVLYRVHSRSCSELVIDRIMSAMKSMNGRTRVDYVQITGDAKAVQLVKCLEYKGRISPENILQIIRRKIGHQQCYEIEASALHMPKRWCERKGVLLEQKAYGYTIIVSLRQKPKKN